MDSCRSGAVGEMMTACELIKRGWVVSFPQASAPFDLVATDASVDSSSGASIKVFAGDRFDGDASSGSSIRVYGSPEVAESETSSGASIDLRHTQTI